ncbi:Uma2 family endonuclease [Dactylosporangium sp. NPDC000521]|uniref:Uma2 family endonuclease n=1 Tax=Dactylosporangium sp. NPDC000521 TaxID=3363975 RepID=UPI0036D0077C
MSAEVVGRHMPFAATLDDLTAMMTTDEFHRYELSPEGVLSVLPAECVAHATVVSRLIMWLCTAGVSVDRFAHALGLRVPGRDGCSGGRIPDLMVWSKRQTGGEWLPATDVLLVAEVVSAGTEGLDTVTKRVEYAAAGIPRYWVVGRDGARTVTMHRLEDDHYEARASMPLAWLLDTAPAEHDMV